MVAGPLDAQPRNGTENVAVWPVGDGPGHVEIPAGANGGAYGSKDCRPPVIDPCLGDRGGLYGVEQSWHDHGTGILGPSGCRELGLFKSLNGALDFVTSGFLEWAFRTLV